MRAVAVDSRSPAKRFIDSIPNTIDYELVLVLDREQALARLAPGAWNRRRKRGRALRGVQQGAAARRGAEGGADEKGRTV